MNKLEEYPSSDSEHYRSLRILEELARDDSLTQRDLSSRLGIALGLVNSYIKNLVKKGFITIKTIPSKRYAYYLTPKGFTEKTRLTYDLLHDYTRVYREARKNLKLLFREMQDQGLKRIIFVGADEIAEIAYITLHETDLSLLAIVDEDRSGEFFFTLAIGPLSSVNELTYDALLVTSYLKGDRYYRELMNNGIPKNLIRGIFGNG